MRRLLVGLTEGLQLQKALLVSVNKLYKHYNYALLKLNLWNIVLQQLCWEWELI